jgi:hypothetical protein
MFRWGWDRLDARLIDRRFIRRDAYNAHNPSSSYQVWEYLVEFSDGGGRRVRLPIREKTFKIDVPENGGVVPIRVNRRRTKAAFDLDDPRIDAVGRRDRRAKAKKAADEARFKAKLDETNA